jgi:multiple sugar transport system permease protein
VQAARSALVLFFAFPIVFMVVSSFRTDTQIFADLGSLRAFLPVGHVSLDAFRGVFDRVPTGRFLLNSSFIIATLIVPFETIALPLVWWVNKPTPR